MFLKGTVGNWLPFPFTSQSQDEWLALPRSQMCSQAPKQQSPQPWGWILQNYDPQYNSSLYKLTSLGICYVRESWLSGNIWLTLGEEAVPWRQVNITVKRSTTLQVGPIAPDTSQAYLACKLKADSEPEPPSETTTTPSPSECVEQWMMKLLL